MCFSAAASPARNTYGTAVQHNDGKIVVKNDCHVVRYGSRHRRRSMELVIDENHLAWSAEPLRIQYAFHLDGKPIHLLKRIKLCNIEIISAAIVRRETRFTYTIQSVLNYARAFEEDYAVSLVKARLLDIVDVMMLFNFLATKFKATYVC